MDVGDRFEGDGDDDDEEEDAVEGVGDTDTGTGWARRSEILKPSFLLIVSRLNEWANERIKIFSDVKWSVCH